MATKGHAKYEFIDPQSLGHSIPSSRAHSVASIPVIPGVSSFPSSRAQASISRKERPSLSGRLYAPTN